MTGGAAASRAALESLIADIGGQPRPGQTAMAVAVAEALDDSTHLFVQAGTGTGKSFAYLVPAVQWSLTKPGRVLVSTATLALQRQLIGKDLPTVVSAVAAQVGREPSVALLKGRSNYLCRLRLSESQAGSSAGEDGLFELPGRLEQQADLVRSWAGQTSTGDRDDLPRAVDARVWRAMSVSGRECVGRMRCPVGADCFAEAARDAAAEADVVVTNHTLLAIDLAGDVPVLPEYDVAIIDEAHELTARLTQATTEVLTVPGITDAVRAGAGLVGDTALGRCRTAAEAFESALGELPDGGSDRRIKAMPARLVRALAVLRDATHAAVSELGGESDEGSLSKRQRAVAALTEVHDRAGLLLAEDDGLVRWSTAEPAGLSCAPLSVAGAVGGGLMGRATVVATSATVKLGGSFGAVAADWGLAGPGRDLQAPDSGTGREGWSSLDVGSPFDYGRQAILYHPADLPPPGRDGPGDAVLARIGALIRAAGGRTLVLASSWRSVDAIAEYIRDAAIADAPLLVQERGTPVAPLVAQFTGQERTVLVGTLSLWQGVDVPGPACSCVIIEKIPFPRPDDPVLAARSEAAAARGANGFSAVSLPHAALLLAQGAGRLIRTHEDRGVVAVLDSRLTRRSYGRYLLDSLPDMWRTDSTEQVLAALNRLRSDLDAT